MGRSLTCGDVRCRRLAVGRRKPPVPAAGPVCGAAGAVSRGNGRLLAETRADGTVVEREVTGEAEARRLLGEEFGIEASDGMTLPPPA